MGCLHALTPTDPNPNPKRSQTGTSIYKEGFFSPATAARLQLRSVLASFIPGGRETELNPRAGQSPPERRWGTQAPANAFPTPDSQGQKDRARAGSTQGSVGWWKGRGAERGWHHRSPAVRRSAALARTGPAPGPHLAPTWLPPGPRVPHHSGAVMAQSLSNFRARRGLAPPNPAWNPPLSSDSLPFFNQTQTELEALPPPRSLPAFPSCNGQC